MQVLFIMNATHSIATTLSDFYNIDTSNKFNIHDAAPTTSVYVVCLCSATKNLVCILQGDQKVGMHATGWSESWYEYYRVIKKLLWILLGDQKVGTNITGRPKYWYEYYRVTKKVVWILQGDQKICMNITGWSQKLQWILQADQKAGIHFFLFIFPSIYITLTLADHNL
jgi:hypothetical protein